MGLKIHYVTFRPVSLSSYEKRIWASGEWQGIPNGTLPLDENNEKGIIESLIAELNKCFAVNLSASPSCARAPSVLYAHSSTTAAQHFTIVGASLASALATSLEKHGAATTLIKLPSWRPNPGVIAKAAADLEAALTDGPPTTILFQNLDGATYYARCEDGSLIPARRGADGKYHLDGELVVAPKELFLHSLKTCLPLFKAGGKEHMILLSPLPRYWRTGCCEDPEHIPNKVDEEYEDYLMDGIDSLRRQCKDFLFKNKLSHIRVMNTAQLMCNVEGSSSTPADVREALATTWGDDPVHPSVDLTDKLAANLVTAAPAATTAGPAQPQQSQREAKRPRWLEEETVTAVRPQVFDARQGRGRGRGRGGFRRN